MLRGVRVLDLSRVIAGPYCATLLGDLGGLDLGYEAVRAVKICITVDGGSTRGVYP